MSEKEKIVKKQNQLYELYETEIWKDFQKINHIKDLLDISLEEFSPPYFELLFWNKETLIKEIKWHLDSIEYCDYDWANDMKYYHSEMHKKLVRRIKYYLNKHNK